MVNKEQSKRGGKITKRICMYNISFLNQMSSDPSLNLANLVTIECIYTNVQSCMSSECTSAYNAIRTELFSLLTNVAYVPTSPINSTFVITNVTSDVSGGLIDSPYITCVYSWTSGTTPDIKPQKILQVISSELKRMRLKAFYTSSLTDCKSTLTVYYPTATDKRFITSST